MKNRLKLKAPRFFAVALAALILVSATPVSSFAEVRTILDPEEKLQYLYTFNSSVNKIKEDKPYFKYAKYAGLSENESISVSSKTGDDLSEEQKKYFMILIDLFFNPKKNIVKNLFDAIFGNQSPYTYKEVQKGMDATDLLPVSGKPYVSGLTSDDIYTLKVEELVDRLNPDKNKSVMRYDFQEYTLENVKDSSLEKLFDLPSGSMNPFDAFVKKAGDGRLSDVKFENFRYHDAYVQAEYNAAGELSKYTQNISYTFSFSFYDIIRIISATTAIDFMGVALAIANPILSYTGKPEFEAKNLLSNSTMFFQYDVKMELNDFDWKPRYFGDIDNNGEVNAYDARSALRHAVALELIKDQQSLIYADVDFDGFITANDARETLRTSVGLEEKFSVAPKGKTVKIVVLSPLPEQPPDTEEDDEDGGAASIEKSRVDMDGINEALSDFTKGIFNIINAIKGEADATDDAEGIVKSIQDLVAGIEK